MKPADKKTAALRRHRVHTARHYLKTLVLACLLLAFATLFGYLATGPVTTALHQRASAAWPTTQGLVTGTGVNAVAGNGQERYAPRVTYRYFAQKVVRTGRRIRLPERVYTDRQQALDALAAYRRGTVVTVRYNPADPEMAVLEPGLQPRDLLPAALPGGLGLLFAFTALGTLFRAVRHRPRNPYEPVSDLFREAVRKRV